MGKKKILLVIVLNISFNFKFIIAANESDLRSLEGNSDWLANLDLFPYEKIGENKNAEARSELLDLEPGIEDHKDDAQTEVNSASGDKKNDFDILVMKDLNRTDKVEKYVNYDSDDPEANRYAPSPEFSVNNYVMTEARWKKIRSEFMYWYFDKGGDNNNGDLQIDIYSSTQIHKNFNFQLPFYGFRYNYTFLSMNGYLGFSDAPEHYTYPLNFPIKDWPKKNDPAFIGIFFSKCRIGTLRPTDYDQRRPGVYFRQERDLQKRTDQFGVELRERVKWDIREGVVGSDSFDPKHAVIVTWKNMSFAGGIDNSLYKTNTFQLVLATDEVYTYAMFNYLDLSWTTHTEAGGDTTGGEGGTPAFIGFNAGNGTQAYEYKPYSQMSTLRDLTSRGWANGFKGRHIFRIDEKIMLGTCNKDIAGPHLPLVFAPESGNMLGGTVVNITGPCFEKTDKVRCLFDTVDVMGTVIDINRAICVQPFVKAEGYIRFAVAVNSGTFDWKGKYFIVQISIWGYRETTIRSEFEYIDTLERGTTNTGEYIIIPASYRNRETPAQLDMQFGFIQINLTNPKEYYGLELTPQLWSKPIPLAWYFGPQWERTYGTKWPQELCNEWIKNDRYLKNFAAEQWGSKPQRSHNLGYLPWNEANKVPSLSHWYHDVVPMYTCCLWQEEQAVGCETLRFERRPSQDCIAYQSPAVAAVFGDPHIVTFDNVAYTFNGKGEHSLKFQHFHGVVVYTPTYILNQSEVIIMFDTGVGIEVVENQGFMSARVYLPWTYMNKTRGLFGNWSNDILDEFTLPDGRQVPYGNLDNFETVHKDFAINWILEDKIDPLKGNSLFVREFGRTASYFSNRTFVPEWRRRPEDFLPANRSVDVDRARELCGDSYQCQYDYAITLNRDLAHFTKNYHDTLTQIKAINSGRTISCGVLETPRFGRKSNFLFIPGTKVTFECNQDFVLIGDQRRTCMPDGHWDIPEYGYTECLPWTTMGIISAVLIPAIALMAAVFVCLKKNSNQGSSTKSWRFSERSALDNDSFTRSVIPRDRPISPVTLTSDSSTITNTSAWKRRSYDRVYHTHEPLPNRPDIEFEDKDWDLKEPSLVSHQEYSSRQAGVTTGIILGCLIPIIMVIICVAFRALQSRRKERESQESQMRSRTTELQRIRKIDDDINESSTTPTEIRATEIN
ncbi:hypothetical protein G9C98_003049 [Cotesia typhae]|uniref:Protein mesh n=1 Tax=Cotesia typhae TaxID=2053667 RepID=A0A8J5QL52_9HYME|nr:hypothetical protein G9C98_003049 [Cotesia typhae]